VRNQEAGILHTVGPRTRIEGTKVAEVLVQFTDPVFDDDGRRYVARACGSEMKDGRWQGWIEFVSDEGEAVRSSRETTQPNRHDTEYWATGLTQVYLDGALQRALKPLRLAPDPIIPAPVFDGPASTEAPPPPESILNPFSVYRKGEAMLRSQLAALSSWHLVNIAQAHRLTDADGPTLSRLSATALIELIVSGVRETKQPANL
jgi:hypothetical protein